MSYWTCIGLVCFVLIIIVLCKLLAPDFSCISTNKIDEPVGNVVYLRKIHLSHKTICAKYLLYFCLISIVVGQIFGEFAIFRFEIHIQLHCHNLALNELTLFVIVICKLKNFLMLENKHTEKLQELERCCILGS